MPDKDKKDTTRILERQFCVEKHRECAEMFFFSREPRSESKRKVNILKLWYLPHVKGMADKDTLQRRAKVKSWPQLYPNFTTIANSFGGLGDASGLCQSMESNPANTTVSETSFQIAGTPGWMRGGTIGTGDICMYSGSEYKNLQSFFSEAAVEAKVNTMAVTCFFYLFDICLSHHLWCSKQEPAGRALGVIKFHAYFD